MADMDIAAAGEAHAIPPPDAPGAGGRARRRRWPVVVLVLLVLLIAAWLVLGAWNVNDYALTPGDATPVSSFIKVPKNLDHTLTGKVLFTDVYVTQLNVLTYLQERYLSSDAQVVSAADLLGPSTPESQFLAQGYLEMNQAQSWATAAALSDLGYTVTSRNTGALLYGIAPGAPVASVLKVGQIITGVNGTATPTECAVVTALHGLKPGTSATFSVERSSISPSGAFEAGPIVHQKVTLGTPPKGLTEPGCGAADTVPTAYLGVDLQTQQVWKWPIDVKVAIPNVGGPSAGLAMTLGIIDKLSGGHLTGNRIVAATGTMAPGGQVGDVGGVAQKTIAVERAGATVFFVPPQEYQAALSTDTPQLHVYAVSSLDQVLRILKRLGGRVPDGHVPAQAAP
jgi:Lon-like protease